MIIDNRIFLAKMSHGSLAAIQCHTQSFCSHSLCAWFQTPASLSRHFQTLLERWCPVRALTIVPEVSLILHRHLRERRRKKKKATENLCGSNKICWRDISEACFIPNTLFSVRSVPSCLETNRNLMLWLPTSRLRIFWTQEVVYTPWLVFDEWWGRILPKRYNFKCAN